MNSAEKVGGYFEALMASMTINVFIPLVAFVLIFAMFVWVLFVAQRGDNFDASQFLRDDSGKLSKGGLFAFVACATHTWVIMVETINARLTVEMAALYCVTWSGSLLILEGIRAWRGVKEGGQSEGGAK